MITGGLIYSIKKCVAVFMLIHSRKMRKKVGVVE